MDLITWHLQSFSIVLLVSLKNIFQVRFEKFQSVNYNRAAKADKHLTGKTDASLPSNNQDEKETVVPQTIDYRISILHIRPEIRDDVEFLATYYARESRGKRFVEEMLTKAFKLAHPSWIIKKVTVEAKP